MENSQHAVNSPVLPSSTQEVPASTSAAAPESPNPPGSVQYSFREAVRLCENLMNYIVHHKEVHGCEPTSFPPEFHIPVDSAQVQEGVARGLDVRTQQELANAFVAAAAYYVHNVTSRAEQANDAAHDAALSDSSSGAAKTEVPETAHEVLDTVTGVLDNATAVSDTATDVPSAVCDAGDE